MLFSLSWVGTGSIRYRMGLVGSFHDDDLAGAAAVTHAVEVGPVRQFAAVEVCVPRFPVVLGVDCDTADLVSGDEAVHATFLICWIGTGLIRYRIIGLCVDW